MLRQSLHSDQTSAACDRCRSCGERVIGLTGHIRVLHSRLKTARTHSMSWMARSSHRSQACYYQLFIFGRRGRESHVLEMPTAEPRARCQRDSGRRRDTRSPPTPTTLPKSALELLDDRLENARADAVQPKLVHVHPSRPLNLGPVPHHYEIPRRAWRHEPDRSVDRRRAGPASHLARHVMIQPADAADDLVAEVRRRLEHQRAAAIDDVNAALAPECGRDR